MAGGRAGIGGGGAVGASRDAARQRLRRLGSGEDAAWVGYSGSPSVVGLLRVGFFFTLLYIRGRQQDKRVYVNNYDVTV